MKSKRNLARLLVVVFVFVTLFSSLVSGPAASAVNLSYGPNLVTNGDFTADKTGWNNGGAGTLDNTDPVTPESGKYLVETGIQGWGSGDNIKILNASGIKFGKDYELSFDYKGQYMVWLGGDEWGTAMPGLDNAQATSATWTKATYTFKCVNPGVNFCTLRFMCTTSSVLFADNISLREVTDLDATSTPTSTPTPTPNSNPVNLVANGSFADGLTGWDNQATMGT
ncbi:MAG: hypothetical protein WCQ41_07040, partial [Bacillota bacterium]